MPRSNRVPRPHGGRILIGAMVKKLLRIDDAAARLGLNRQDVLAMVRAGRLRGIVVDGVMRVAEQDVQFLLADRAALDRALASQHLIVDPTPRA